MSIDTFNLFLGVMSLIALLVFIALYFVKAGYGIFRTASWGVAISNKLAWILMEAPVFVVMCVMWIYSERRAGGLHFLSLLSNPLFSACFHLPFAIEREK